MHGKRQFILVGDAYADVRRPAGGRRLKRSRHRTTVDVFLVREAEVKWIGRRFGKAPAPKWYRRALNRRYRARMKDLMGHGRFDDLHPPPRDGSWYW